VLLTIAFIMAFTGIGLIMGARYPNFDESMGGMPDVMSMYLTLLICLLVGGGMAIFAGYIMAAHTIAGILTLIIVLEVGFVIMLIGIKGGARMYSRMEPSVV
jgi:hypothetical protein